MYCFTGNQSALIGPKQHRPFTLNDLPDKSSCKRESIAREHIVD
jgi:hypothetical protein